MNPFLLPGPQFLIFYFVFGVCANYFFYRFLASQGGKLNVSAGKLAQDPYKVAYLRGGKSEAVAVATVALHDRGLLVWSRNLLQTATVESVQLVSRPIEKALLNYYLQPREPEIGLSNISVNAACEIYKRKLNEEGLLVSPEMLRQRVLPGMFTLSLLVACSWIKINIAFANGHHNIIFLLVLTIFFTVVVLIQFFGRLTAAGKELLAHLRRLFALLKDRAAKLQSGGETNEAALVAAVFGLGVLSAAQFPFVNRLLPSNMSSNSGSSCSSSSCSSGSSCGGGGGCGGCGS
jgi:uncharacterized protein (TIGR04222 family)